MSIFSKIVAGEIPSYKLAEDENYFAFLDINPLAKGHALVIPKQEVDYLFDLDDPIFLGLMAFAKKVAKAIEACVTCKRIGVAVIGLEVPHAHVHLVPINDVHDLDFSRERVKLSEEELIELASQISQQID
jgi:histidine triad (HIT) family protein